MKSKDGVFVCGSTQVFGLKWDAEFTQLLPHLLYHVHNTNLLKAGMDS